MSKTLNQIFISFFIFISSSFVYSQVDSAKTIPDTSNKIIDTSKIMESPLQEKIILHDTIIEKTFIQNLPFTITGYVDTYYSMDNDQSHTTERFAGVSPHRDEYRLNIAQLSLKYSERNVRGNLTIQYGDIPDVLYPEKQRLLPEANIGFSPWENVWIDAGYFVTHIGTESPRPMENVFSSYAMVSYYEPLPQAGAVVSYTTRRFNGAFWVMNGYGALTDNNKNKSLGLSLTWWPFKNVSLSYNNIGGNESIDLDNQKLRLYNNFILRAYYGEHWNVTINNDFAIQQNSKLGDSTAMGSMAGGFFTVKYTFKDPKFSLAMRGEYLTDFDGIFSSIYDIPNTSDRTGLMIFGPSLAFEYKPLPNAYVRLEGRYLKTMRDLQIFSGDKDYRIDGSVTMGVGF